MLVLVIAKSCEMGFSNRQKQHVVPKTYWLSKRSWIFAGWWLQIDSIQSTMEVDDWLQSQNLERSSKKMADTGEFYLSEQIHLSKHFSNLPWPKVFGYEDALYQSRMGKCKKIKKLKKGGFFEKKGVYKVIWCMYKQSETTTWMSIVKLSVTYTHNKEQYIIHQYWNKTTNDAGITQWHTCWSD